MKRLLLVTIIMLVAVGGALPGCGGGGEESTSPASIPTPTPKLTPTLKSTPAPAPSDITMLSIPGGAFQMGDRSGSGYGDERPVHSVTLSPFQMSAYEVTYAQWMKVKNWAEAHDYSFNMPGDRGSEEYGGTQDDTHPVTNMEWYDAVLWCNALSEMEGRTPAYYTSAARSTVYRSGRLDIQNDWVKWDANGYRLPTEAEWEYACCRVTSLQRGSGLAG